MKSFKVRKLKYVSKQIIIIGAGPAGLGCAYELSKPRNPNHHSASESIINRSGFNKRAFWLRGKPHNNKILLFDKNDCVGGLARTKSWKHHCFDIGPHRFFTKNPEVLKLWKFILKKDLITVKRLTRILYKNKLFHYPVRLTDVIAKLGLWESAQCFISYLQAKVFLTKKDPKTFEEWITKYFGKKLYSIFFKTYTEKVWGIPCSKIGAEWASQRIKNLNFYEVVKTAIFGERVRKAKSLVDTFYYPTKGAGYFYEKLAQVIKKNGTSIKLNHQVTAINHRGKYITSVDGIPVSYLISSMPLTHFIEALNPLPPESVLQAAKKLYYRDHITVNLIVNKTNLFPDNWIYVHSSEVQMARVTNYNNFTNRDIRYTKQSAIAVEYFVFKNDRLWKMKDKELIQLASNEVEKVGLIDHKDISSGFVVRESESYPTYYLGHKQYFETLKEYVSRFRNLQLIGRGGMYKYNNMDHAIYSGMLAARNYLSGNKKYDVWRINEDAEYLEK